MKTFSNRRTAPLTHAGPYTHSKAGATVRRTAYTGTNIANHQPRGGQGSATLSVPASRALGPANAAEKHQLAQHARGRGGRG
jgi:hypothetical protein